MFIPTRREIVIRADFDLQHKLVSRLKRYYCISKGFEKPAKRRRALPNQCHMDLLMVLIVGNTYIEQKHVTLR